MVRVRYRNACGGRNKVGIRRNREAFSRGVFPAQRLPARGDDFEPRLRVIVNNRQVRNP